MYFFLWLGLFCWFKILKILGFYFIGLITCWANCEVNSNIRAAIYLRLSIYNALYVTLIAVFTNNTIYC